MDNLSNGSSLFWIFQIFTSIIRNVYWARDGVPAIKKNFCAFRTMLEEWQENCIVYGIDPAWSLSLHSSVNEQSSPVYMTEILYKSLISKALSFTRCWLQSLHSVGISNGNIIFTSVGFRFMNPCMQWFKARSSYLQTVGVQLKTESLQKLPA